MHEVPLRNIKVATGRASSATRITGPIFLSDAVNSGRYNGQLLSQFFENVSDVEMECESFKQNCATARTVNNSMAA
jgi:hypothetical protein